MQDGPYPPYRNTSRTQPALKSTRSKHPVSAIARDRSCRAASYDEMAREWSGAPAFARGYDHDATCGWQAIRARQPPYGVSFR